MAEHYYSQNQRSALNLKKISAVLRGIRLEFYSGSGVFSKDKVDRGTEVLIENCAVENKWDVLDLGCGYGAVGIAVAKAFPNSKVILSDVNKRALKLAKMNVELNKVENAYVVFSDLYSGVLGEFDTILSNPPMSAGRELCFRIIEEAKDYLKKGGFLQMVAKHRKGGKMLEEKMLGVFGNVEAIAKFSGYRVYISKKE